MKRKKPTIKSQRSNGNALGKKRLAKKAGVIKARDTTEEKKKSRLKGEIVTSQV